MEGGSGFGLCWVSDSQEEAMTDGTLFERRFSCRSFTPEPLDRETLTPLLDAARWAPNGGNLQPWRFIEVRRS